MVLARRRPRVRRTHAARARARRSGARSSIETDADATPAAIELRQAQPPDVTIEPSTGRGALDAQRRRAPARRAPRCRRSPRAAAARSASARARSTATASADLLVYPDVFAAQRLVDRAAARPVPRSRAAHARAARPRHRVRVGPRLPPRRRRAPDQLEATDRVGRPMSNQYRIEQDRDVVCLLDAGPADGGAAPRSTIAHARITRLDARGRRGHDGRARRRRARRPVRRDGLRLRDPAPARAPPQRAARRWCARSSTSSRRSSTATTTSRSARSAA